MPIKIDSVFYELALHDEEFAAALRNSVKNLDQLDSGAKKADRSIGGLEHSIAGAKEELKRFATNLVEAAAVREFIRNTVDAQASLAQLQATLKSTGGAAGFTLPELEKMSEEMSRLSVFSDEAVRGGLSRLLTYTGIQGPMFKEAARATLDFASALRIDVNSAAERVGNALQYPTEAINSLTKQGFRFTSEQKRLIASFEDTGQLAKAQAIILGELDLAYKGSAEAARGTLGGALVYLKNQFMETLEVSQENSGGLIEALNSVGDAMPSLREKFSAFFGGIGLLAVDASIRVQKFLNLFRKNGPTDAELEAFRAEEERKILGLDRPTTPTGGRAGGTTPRGLTDAQLDAQRNARLAFQQATAGQTEGAADNFETGVTKLVAAAQKAHLGAAEIAKMVGELRSAHAEAMAEEGQKLAQTLQGQLAELTATTVDDLRAQLAEFDRAIEDQRSKGVLIDPTVVEQLRAAKEQAIALAPQTEAIAKAMERIDAATKEGFNLTGALGEISALIDKATAIRDALPEDSSERASAQERLNHLIEREAEIRKQLRAIIIATGNESQKFAANVANVSGAIANIANVAFGLASAFAGANSELVKMLGSTAQIAGGISNVADLASKAGGFGKLFSSGAGIISALPGIGQAIGGAISLASSLFGKSPEEQARLQALKENNIRLHELSTKVGDLARINVQGTDLGRVQQFFASAAIQNLLNNPAAGVLSQDAVNRQVGTVLTAMGLTATQFEDIAKQFGITVGTGSGGKITLDDLRQFFAALGDSELNQFAQDFTGQMQRMNAEIAVFSLTKPIQQFEEFRKVVGSITGGSGALGKLLQGLDLTTSAGVEAAQQAVQDLFKQFQGLSGDELATFLGGLTPEDFVNAIQKLTDLINAQASGGGIAGTGGFNVDRTITEVTGSRLEALLSTSNIFEEQIADNTALIARLLGGGAVPVINAPAMLSSSLASTGGPLVHIENLSVTVSGLDDLSRAQDIGAKVGSSVLDEIDRGLGKRLQIANRARGVMN